MADGYGAGLFDDSGPKAFASAVGSISNELTGVQSAFTSFGTTAQGSLTAVSNAIDTLLGKLGQLSSQLTGLGAQVGGGGAQGQGSPAPQQGGPTAPPQWANPPQPNAQTGSAAPMTGMPQNTASQGGWWSRQWGWMTQGTAGTANAPYGGSQSGAGVGGGGADFTMGQRAVQSLVPAAIGAAGRYAGGLTAAAVQGATIGGTFAPMFGVNPRSLYMAPTGFPEQNPQDYAQAAYIALMNGIAPGTQNWSSIMGTSGSVADLTRLIPGSTPQMNAQGVVSAMGAPTMNTQLAFGFNFSPGGKMLSANQQYEQVWNRFTRVMGGKVSGKQLEDLLFRPNAPWQQNLSEELGWAPGSPMAQGFQMWAAQRVGLTTQGKAVPADIGSAAGIAQTGIGGTPGYAQLQRESARSRLEQQAEPALAAASKNLNEAATKLLNLAGDPGAAFLGVGGGGGVGSMVGSLANLGMTGAGMYFGTKALGRLGGGLLGRVGGGLLGRVGGGAAGRVGGGLLGRLGGLFGGGAAGEEAAAGVGTLGEVGGLEAAGAAADATGVGLPVGLILGGAGLAVGAWGFRHQIGHGLSALGHGIGNIAGGLGRDIGSAASGIGSGIGAAASGIGHGIGSFFGGLFGGSPAGASTPSDPTGTVQALLSGRPPRNSLIACLTQPINRNSNTLAAALLNGSTMGGIGGGTAATDLSYKFSGTSTTGGSPSTAATAVTGGGGAGGAPTSGTASQNAALGQQMAAAMGWTGAEWTALNNVAMKESGWSTTAKNPTSPAYGIAQFIGGPSEYAQYGGDSTTAKGQITGFLNYIKQRYGSPSAAWQHEQQYGWYERGTQLVARTQLAMLHRGEAVIPAADNYSSGPYNKRGAVGTGSGAIHLNFKPGSIVLQVPAGASAQDMDSLANQFVAAVSKPAVIAGVRSS